MTNKAVALQGGLAAVGLLTAYLTWQREPERAPGEVTIIDATKNELRSIHYEDDKVAYDLSRGDEGIWIHFVDKFVPKADPSKKDAPPAPGTPPRDLRGTEAAGKALDQFAPLRSPRAFGVLDAQKMKELGLDGSVKKLDVTAKGDTRHFTIGQPVGAPGGESFLRDAADGRVYVIPRGLLSDLQAAQGRLIDRRMHAFITNDFDRVTVTAQGKTKAYVQIGRERGPGASQFAPAGTPDKPDQTIKNWHDVIWRTFPMEILGKGEMPKEGAPKLVARVEYFDGKKSIGWMELGKLEALAAGQSGGGASGEIMARSEHTPSWVSLHTNASILTDTEKMATGSN